MHIVCVVCCLHVYHTCRYPQICCYAVCAGTEWIFVQTHDAVTYVQEVLLEAAKAMPTASGPSENNTNPSSSDKGGIQLALRRFKGWRHKGPKAAERKPAATTSM